MGRRTRRLAGSLVLAALSLTAVVAVMAALTKHDGGDTEPRTSSASVDPQFVTARDGVCEAEARARAGDAPGARSVFLGRAHQPLHQLAAATQIRDRAAAARLLEAKARVEASIDPPRPTLADDLDTLALAAGRAIRSLGGNDRGPCT